MQAVSDKFKAVVAGNEMTVEHQVTVSLPGPVRRNLCRAPNGRSLTGWSAFGAGVLDLDPTRTHTGDQSIKVSTSGATNDGITCSLTAEVGTAYTASAWVFIAAGAPALTMNRGVAQDVSTVSDGWQRLAITWTATTVSDSFDIQLTAAAGGPVDWWVSEVLIEAAGTVGDYFDGDTGGSWDGIPGASTSHLSTVYPDLTLAVDGFTVDRSMTTDMPDGTRLITGYPAAQGSVTLSGLVDPLDESKTAAWLFNSYSTDSPLFRYDLTGTPIVVKLGLYPEPAEAPELVTVFTGSIDDLSVDPAAGTVTLQLLDPRNKIRALPNLPPVAAVYDVPEGSPPILLTLAPGLTGAWLLDTICRTNGYHACPPPRTGCAFYASMNGSAFPQIYNATGYPVQAGRYSNGIDFSPTGEVSGTPPMEYVEGHFAAKICQDVEITASAASTIEMGVGGGWFAEFWWNAIWPVPGAFQPQGPGFRLTNTNGSFGANYSQDIQIQPYDGIDQWYISSPAFSAHQFTMAQGWHQISIQITCPTSTTVVTKLWVDGVLTVNATDTGTPAPAGTVADTVNFYSDFPVEAVQVTNEAAPTPAGVFTPTAFIDESLNMLTAIPGLGQGDPWQVIQAVAQAELGVAGFDEVGAFRFRNRRTLADAAPVRTISAKASLKKMTLQTSGSAVRTHVVVPVAALNRSPYQAVWSASADQTLYYAPARSTRSLLVSTTDPVVGASTLCGPMQAGGINANWPFSGYRAARKPDGTGGEISNLGMSVYQLSPTSFRITITNPNGFNAYLVSPSGSGYPSGSDGQPCLAVGGEFLSTTATAPDGTAQVSTALTVSSQWPPGEEGGAADNPRGDVALQIPDNQFIQVVESAQVLADDTLIDFYRPRPFWRNVDIVPDPSLQLADRNTVDDPDVTGVQDEDGVLFGIHITGGKASLSMTVDLRAASAPGAWVMGVAGKSEMGVTSYV